jgi:hypothetical protein
VDCGFNHQNYRGSFVKLTSRRRIRAHQPNDQVSTAEIKLVSIPNRYSTRSIRSHNNGLDEKHPRPCPRGGAATQRPFNYDDEFRAPLAVTSSAKPKSSPGERPRVPRCSFPDRAQARYGLSQWQLAPLLQRSGDGATLSPGGSVAPMVV